MQAGLKRTHLLELSVSADKRVELFLKKFEAFVCAPLSAGSEVSESYCWILFQIVSMAKELRNKPESSFQIVYREVVPCVLKIEGGAPRGIWCPDSIHMGTPKQSPGGDEHGGFQQHLPYANSIFHRCSALCLHRKGGRKGSTHSFCFLTRIDCGVVSNSYFIL